MNDKESIAGTVLNTPEPDRWVDCGESRPLPMFHMATIMQYGERCAEAAISWLRSKEKKLTCGHPDSLLLMSAETDQPLYCELCDAQSARRDAENMETELRISHPIHVQKPANDDREYLAAIALLGNAMRRLVIAARTNGGTAGPDDELIAACIQAEDAMSIGAIGRAMACAAPQPAIPDGWQSVAARDVLAERIRQMESEGWTLAHDDEHGDGSLAQAAACYALGAATDNPDRHVMDRFGIEGTPYHVHSLWPFDRQWFKPVSRRCDLVKAGALILAEIERLDRAVLAAAPEQTK